MREDFPKRATQTEHFRNLSSATGEIDLLLQGSDRFRSIAWIGSHCNSHSRTQCPASSLH